jgi:putative addiction module component (TIGR02574 family)
MTQTAEALKVEALKLPSDDREELAYFLLRSLDKGQSDVQAAWEVELAERWREIEGGSGEGRSAEDVFAGLRKKYP